MFIVRHQREIVIYSIMRLIVEDLLCIFVFRKLKNIERANKLQRPLIRKGKENVQSVIVVIDRAPTESNPQAAAEPPKYLEVV